jgi:hypothetical protein
MGVISNPPYIPTEDLPGLQPEVGWHEPKLALDGGRDGLEHLLHLFEGLSSVLKPGGFFVFEVKHLPKTFSRISVFWKLKFSLLGCSPVLQNWNFLDSYDLHFTINKTTSEYFLKGLMLL